MNHSLNPDPIEEDEINSVEPIIEHESTFSEQASSARMDYLTTIHKQVEQRLNHANAPTAQLWQLANDRDVYGEKAGQWILVDHTNEQELIIGEDPWPTQDKAELELDYINRISAGLSEIKSGNLTEESLTHLCGSTLLAQQNGNDGLLIQNSFDWTGDVHVRGCVELKDASGKTYIEEADAEDAQFYGVYMQMNDGRSLHHSDHDTITEAQEASNRLRIVYQQAHKLTQFERTLLETPYTPTEEPLKETVKDNESTTEAVPTDNGFSVPENVRKAYIEMNGKYYFNNRPDTLAFIDKGMKLQTKLNTAGVARSLIDIAEERKWTELQLKGTIEFRREAWLQATSKGMSVKGYRPQQEDLAKLKKLTSERPTNEVSVKKNSLDKQTVNSDVDADINPLKGKLLAHGAAPYKNNPDNKKSYYVTLENNDGQERTTWGVDLKRTLSESNIKIGQTVELENHGQQPVKIQVPVKDEKGKVVGSEQIETHRNTWEIKAEALKNIQTNHEETVKKHPDLVNEISVLKMAEKFSQEKFDNDSDKQIFMDKVADKIAEKVSNGERSPDIKIREEQTLEQETETER